MNSERVHRYLLYFIVGANVCTLAILWALWHKPDTYGFNVPCDVDKVRYALSIMEPGDTIQHEPCSTEEQEADINALYEEQQRRDDGVTAPWERTFDYDRK